jgi:hypothetical protein
MDAQDTAINVSGLHLPLSGPHLSPFVSTHIHSQGLSTCFHSIFLWLGSLWLCPELKLLSEHYVKRTRSHHFILFSLDHLTSPT